MRPSPPEETPQESRRAASGSNRVAFLLARKNRRRDRLVLDQAGPQEGGGLFPAGVTATPRDGKPHRPGPRAGQRPGAGDRPASRQAVRHRTEPCAGCASRGRFGAFRQPPRWPSRRERLNDERRDAPQRCRAPFPGRTASDDPRGFWTWQRRCGRRRGAWNDQRGAWDDAPPRACPPYGGLSETRKTSWQSQSWRSKAPC